MNSDQNLGNGSSHTQDAATRQPTPRSVDLADELSKDIEQAGGPFELDSIEEGSIGRTMYDAPNSEDNTLTVLLPMQNIDAVGAQSLVRIKSRALDKGGDGRQYLAAVTAGPFAEPDGLRADTPLIVTTTVHGATFLPRWHGRVQVEIIGEELRDGSVLPPRFRPRPNSPVFKLEQDETASKLKLNGEITIGVAVGHENMPVGLTVTKKDVYFRHVGVLGTTGSGKSTDVARQMAELNREKVAVVVIDTEGEYTHVMEPTEDLKMLDALSRRGLQPKGLNNVGILHLLGRETRNPSYSDNHQFCLNFSAMSRYVASEILGLNEAQDDRFQKAYDVTRQLLMEFKIYPATEEERQQVLELDEMEEGFPRMTLQHLYEIVRLFADSVAKSDLDETLRYSKIPEFKANAERVKAVIEKEKASNVFSWRKVQGSLSRLLRLGIFDSRNCSTPDYAKLTEPGRITIIDLSDTGSPQVNNLVISQILRGVQLQQEDNYRATEEKGTPPRKVVIVIEEAHEFLSRERIRNMGTLFEQVARIARRGRKRWLGLVFATQLPHHLPDDVLGLLNNFFLHKLTDGGVISRLQKSVGGIDDGLWKSLPSLAPGQALVSATCLARPMLVALDPTPCKLLMVD